MDDVCQKIKTLAKRVEQAGWRPYSSFAAGHTRCMPHGDVRQIFIPVASTFALNPETESRAAWLVTDGYVEWAVVNMNYAFTRLFPSFTTPEAAIAYWELTQKFSEPTESAVK